MSLPPAEPTALRWCLSTRLWVVSDDLEPIPPISPEPARLRLVTRSGPVAVEDLATARRLVNDGKSPHRLAAFLAHLAAEKALKGALIARGIATRKIHDLGELQSLLTSEDVG